MFRLSIQHAQFPANAIDSLAADLKPIALDQNPKPAVTKARMSPGKLSDSLDQQLLIGDRLAGVALGRSGLSE
jgi:hypothetical protein